MSALHCTNSSRKQTTAVSFTINGKPYTATASDKLPIETSLNTFIRNHAHLSGTKFMCLEGGCGACVVSVTGIHPVTQQKSTWAVNSCMYPVFSCHGLEITTIEGLGNKQQGYHPLQKALSQFNGTQCGYCSPGMVMNMHSLLESSEGQLKMEEIENSFGGNICRCTGYRPILDAFKSIATDATDNLKNIAKDIEDLDKICSKTGKTCSGKCSSSNKPTCPGRVLMTDNESREWHKVNTIKEIQEIFQKLSTTSNNKYMLIHGNTAHGVYRRDPSINVFIDVTSVNELHAHKIDKEIELGANLSLTETMHILTTAANSVPEFKYCKDIVKHIDLVANVPVRNVGTLAGNLSIKHAYNEFPSDIFLLLETVAATIIIVDASGQQIRLKPSEFLKVDMNFKIITKITLPALPIGKYNFKSYKIMPRAQNAHAYVNAGFLLELNDKRDKIQNATIVYGGITPEFIHATELEKYLVSKNIFLNANFQEAVKILVSELKPDWILPDASPEYRMNLAVSLFYKFILSLAPTNMIAPKNKSGGETLVRPLSSGTQEFDTKPENYPLGQPIPKLEGLSQCSGEAEYVNDIPVQPNELWAAFVLATEVSAKIIKIDPSEALNLAGVHHFYSAKDIPGINTFMPSHMMMVVEPEEIFCSDKVKYNGQPLGIVLADTMELAYHAASLIKVTYGERSIKRLRPTIHDIFEAKDFDRILDSPVNTEAKLEGTDTDIKIKDYFEMAGQYHFTMETQTCVSIPNDEGLNVYASTQWMDLSQVAIAEALNLPANLVNVFTKRVGGGYGSKISRATLIACASAIGAYLSNRPVRLVLKIEDNMEAIGKRHGVQSSYEVNIDKNGVIQKLSNQCSEDYGSSQNEPVIYGTSGAFGNCYDKSRWGFKGKIAITDAAANTWCRAPGTTEGIAMSEIILEHVAHVVKRDPVDVRLDNMPKDSKLREIIPEFLKSIDYHERKKAIESFNKVNRWTKRGIAVVPMLYKMDYYGTMHAFVAIYHGDGTVAITHGGIEMGQGINTKVAQVAAHVLGIDVSTVKFKQSNTLTAANDTVSGGSQASEAICYAVKKACEEILARMQPIKEKNQEKSWLELIRLAHAADINLTASFLYKHSDLTPYDIWGVSCAEIEIDVLTGNYILTRVDILEDTGESLSPNVDVGQVEGAFVMGIGYWLQEKLVYDNSNGKLLTNRTWNYKVPTVKDIPVDFRIKFLQKSSNPHGVLRSKATGEPAMCMSIVVLSALREAIKAARIDAGLGDDWFHLKAPTTVEDIFLLCGSNKIENFSLN